MLDERCLALERKALALPFVLDVLFAQHNFRLQLLCVLCSVLVRPAINLSNALAPNTCLKLHLVQVAHQALLSRRNHLLHSISSNRLLILLVTLALLLLKLWMAFPILRYLLKPLLALIHSHILTVLIVHLRSHDGLILFPHNIILAAHVVQHHIGWFLLLPPFEARTRSLGWLAAQTVKS